MSLQRATIYIYVYMCTCVRMRLCPVKYEHAGVKPAIDRGKRREKEAAGTGVKRRGGLVQPYLLRRRATGVCSFNSGIFLRSADSDCLSRHPCLYLSVSHSFLPSRVYKGIRDFFVQLPLPLEMLAWYLKSQYR